MLETLLVSGGTWGVQSNTVSDNPTSDADNQQERLLSILSLSELSSYLTGFADGEGSFNISFRKRRDYRLSWKVSACFNISQRENTLNKIY